MNYLSANRRPIVFSILAEYQPSVAFYQSEQCSIKIFIMKKTIYIFASLIIAMSLASCGGEAEPTTSEDSTEETIQYYKYNEGMTTLEWTSYKTTAKVGVSGGFNDIKVTSVEGTSPKEVIESIEFIIQTSSVETNNEDRNLKVAEHFFGTINAPTIEGKVSQLNDDNTAIITITMNGITMDIEGDYTLDGPAFSFTSSIDVSSWNGVPGIDALNTVCEDLHTGEDGVSKLWTEVGLSFSTTLKVVP